ncbi:hypothetical protein CP49_26955 [Bradyrhizobium valentinum]|uniref:Uncharacterized protein n=1 Tax=Bradyrhizobium valentinum TaxID=1518501 RepID=A0A0R3LG99_9BRAD|nr:hypothetical protein CP49_26955 [Bradyrhizobium valentinum]
MDFRGKKIETGPGRVGAEVRMKLHGDGVVAIAANVVAGGDAPIFQPQTLRKASGAAEARVDFEEDVIAAKELVRNKRYAREGRGAGEGNGNRLHENLAVMMTREIQIAGADVYRLGLLTLNQQPRFSRSLASVKR